MAAWQQRGKRVSPEEANALWHEYRSTGDVRIRNRLVMAFAPLVRYIVFKKARELPARCDADDLVSCGLEALIGAIDRFDPDRGVSLEQFAWTRIHGAVLDELRRHDWAPRSLRRRERDIGRARAEIAVRTGRPPTREQLAAALDVTVEELRRRQDELALCDVTSLNAPVGSQEDATVERIDTIADVDDRMDPERAAAARQVKALLRSAFGELPQREREVAVMLYVENLTLREVGDVLGVSESRACQIHAQLKRTLASRLASVAEPSAAAG